MVRRGVALDEPWVSGSRAPTFCPAGATVLHQAAVGVRLNQVKALLAAGAQADPTYTEGTSYGHHALTPLATVPRNAWGAAACALRQALLDAGASPAAPTYAHTTVLETWLIKLATLKGSGRRRALEVIEPTIIDAHRALWTAPRPSHHPQKTLLDELGQLGASDRGVARLHAGFSAKIQADRLVTTTAPAPPPQPKRAAPRL